MTRRLFQLAAVTLLVLTATIATLAQPQTGKTARVGVLMSTELTDAYREALRQGLRDHGHVEGQNIVIEWRHAGGRSDRAAALATELVRLKVDVIVAIFGPAVRAAKGATMTIPIVMAPAGDPVGQGFVASLARPGGNVTGVTGLSADLSGKRLQVIRDLIPNLRRVAVLLDGEPFSKPFLQENETAIRGAGIQLHVEVVRRPDELEGAFARIAKEQSAAVIVQPALAEPTARASRIATLALRHGLLSASHSPDFAEAGGLLSYGVNYTSIVRRAAVYVDKILRGANPGDLPVEQERRFELVVNRRTAKALRIVIPHSVLLQADLVID